MKIKYDPEADAAYISFKKEPTQVTTIRISDDVAVDLGDREEIVGIEILSASSNLGMSGDSPKIELENLKAAYASDQNDNNSCDHKRHHRCWHCNLWPP